MGQSHLLTLLLWPCSHQAEGLLTCKYQSRVYEIDATQSYKSLIMWVLVRENEHHRPLKQYYIF